MKQIKWLFLLVVTVVPLLCARADDYDTFNFDDFAIVDSDATDIWRHRLK